LTGYSITYGIDSTILLSVTAFLQFWRHYSASACSACTARYCYGKSVLRHPSVSPSVWLSICMQ